jgi:hypothetical protein
MLRAILAAAVLVAFQAGAQESTAPAASSGGHSGSVLSGQTVGNGSTVFWGELGFPGLSAAILHGVAPTFDIGGKFTFNYGVEGLTNFIHPELKLNFLGRISLLKKPKFNMGLHFEPGFLMYFINGTNFGINLPVGLQFGIPASSALQVVLAFDMPITIFFGNGRSDGLIPILFGAGVEYRLDRDTLLTFHMGMGPGIDTNGGGSSFVLQSLFGVALPM